MLCMDSTHALLPSGTLVPKCLPRTRCGRARRTKEGFRQQKGRKEAFFASAFKLRSASLLCVGCAVDDNNAHHTRPRCELQIRCHLPCWNSARHTSRVSARPRGISPTAPPPYKVIPTGRREEEHSSATPSRLLFSKKKLNSKIKGNKEARVRPSLFDLGLEQHSTTEGPKTWIWNAILKHRERVLSPTHRPFKCLAYCAYHAGRRPSSQSNQTGSREP